MATSFLQSKEWGEFQTSVGHQAVWFGDTQGFEHRLGLWMSYVYVPRNAIDDKRYMDAMANYFAKQGFAFLRIEPMNAISSIIYHLSSTFNRQPQHTLLIDLSKTEEELLAAMHSKTRYNIHLAVRHGVSVREEKSVDIFWRLHEETANRDKFRGHSRAYYEKMLATSIIKQLIAYVDNIPIASHILIVFDGVCTYLHGASSNDKRNLMAPYLLQWEGVKLGKRLGSRQYDLWGVAPPTQNGMPFHGYTWNPTHPWSGITRFKAGFGGTPVSYPQAVDVVFSPFQYRAYQFIRHLRRMV